MLRFQENGDTRAFEELFQRHKDGFVSFLWRLAGSQPIAEDVSQQCWLRVVELAREGRYRNVSGASFRTYLYTLGRNRYIDAYVRSHGESRTHSWTQAGEGRDIDESADPVRDAAGSERAELIAYALEQLPAEQREVIALWASDFSIEQMSSMTGAPRDTVLSRKKYAIAKLRKLFERMGVEA